MAQGRTDSAQGLTLPSFLLAFDPARPPVVPAGHEVRWAGSAREIEGLMAWPQELFLAGDRAVDEPVAAYAIVDHLGAMTSENPAIAALERLGLARPVERRRTHRTTGPYGDSRVEGLRDRVASDPWLERAWREDLEVQCRALAMPLPGGAWGDAATDLLMDPWAPVIDARATAPQVIALAGPACGPSAVFEGPTATADLGPLDRFGRHYRESPRHAVAAMFARRRC